MESNNNDNVFLGTLTHNDLLHSRMAKAFFSHATMKCNAFIQCQPGSLLAQSYNALWCKALNIRNAFTKEGKTLKWFAILHADIVPEDFWLDKLIDLATKHDADVMSSIVPIKEASGVTSTAVSGVDNFTRAFRLTQHQIHSTDWPMVFDINILRQWMKTFPYREAIGLPITDHARLLVNTGCFVCRFDRPWVDKVMFTINDRIRTTPNGHIAEVEPEDWYFSRRVAEEGGKVMATKLVTVDHIGSIPYNSAKAWGNDLDKFRTV